METFPQHLQESSDAIVPDEGAAALRRVASRLILTYQRQDGSVATQGLARQLPTAARACNVQSPELLRAVVSQLPPPAARRLAGVFPPASLAPRAPWRRKSCVYRMFDALLPVRWSRYRLGRSRYAWVRLRANDRLGVRAFTLVEHAADAAVARFARVVDLHCFAERFATDAVFRDRAISVIRTHAAPELENPSGAGQRLNMIALSDLAAWSTATARRPEPADYTLGAELLMLAIPDAVFDPVTDQLRALLAHTERHVPTQPAPIVPPIALAQEA